jgi:hypothetical protein
MRFMPGIPSRAKRAEQGTRKTVREKIQGMIRNKQNLIGFDIGPLTDWNSPSSFRFSPEDVESLAVLEHERWMKEKLADRWVYGSARDDREKTHPSLVPYDRLPESEKEKDRNAVRMIPRILSLADFQICRRNPVK